VSLLLHAECKHCEPTVVNAEQVTSLLVEGQSTWVVTVDNYLGGAPSVGRSCQELCYRPPALISLRLAGTILDSVLRS
jgi:hypothetical protein